MKKLIILLFLISFCGGSAESFPGSLEEDFITTTTTSSTSSTSSTTTTVPETTTTVPETTTTTVNTEDVVLPTITFPNCPEDQVTGEEFELFIKVTAGNYDLNYLRISQWKNEEYDGRVYYEKSNPDGSFPFPNAEESVEFSVSLFDNDKDQAINYEVFISISDESDAYFEVEERCNVSFNNVQATTTTTSPKSLYPDEPSSDTWIIYTGNGNQVVDVSSVDTTLKIMTVKANGGASIVSYNGNEYLDLLINKNGSEVNNETVLFNFKFEQPTLLEITATADWEIILKPVASARNFSGDEIKGSGSEVIEFYENNSTFQVLTFVSPTGVSVVSYECDGAYNDLVINQLGNATDNSVRSDSGTCYLEIVANGEWTISR